MTAASPCTATAREKALCSPSICPLQRVEQQQSRDHKARTITPMSTRKTGWERAHRYQTLSTRHSALPLRQLTAVQHSRRGLSATEPQQRNALNGCDPCVDDEPDARAMVAAVLTQSGAQVSEAASAEQGLEVCKVKRRPVNLRHRHARCRRLLIHRPGAPHEWSKVATFRDGSDGASAQRRSTALARSRFSRSPLQTD
jgi:hypothetical protein